MNLMNGKVLFLLERILRDMYTNIMYIQMFCIYWCLIAKDFEQEFRISDVWNNNEIAMRELNIYIISFIFVNVFSLNQISCVCCFIQCRYFLAFTAQNQLTSIRYCCCCCCYFWCYFYSSIQATSKKCWTKWHN